MLHIKSGHIYFQNENELRFREVYINCMQVKSPADVHSFVLEELSGSGTKKDTACLKAKLSMIQLAAKVKQEFTKSKEMM